MKNAPDHFSQQADLYAKFRPTYPASMYDWLFSLVSEFQCAWDCGTGNGQVANVLANHFEAVEATDISEKQLSQAVQRKNIQYQISKAEQSPFASEAFNLLTVAQALHWFDHASFFEEVDRVLKPGGILAVWGYDLVRIHPEIDRLVDHYYTEVIGPYWAPERKHVDQQYSQIEFPYLKIAPPADFAIEATWTLSEFEGYLNTWSSLQSYLRKHAGNPVGPLIAEVGKSGLWQKKRTVQFPIFIKAGRKPVV